MGFSAAGFIGPFLAGVAIDHLGHLPAFWCSRCFPVVPIADAAPQAGVSCRRRASTPAPRARAARSTSGAYRGCARRSSRAGSSRRRGIFSSSTCRSTATRWACRLPRSARSSACSRSRRSRSASCCRRSPGATPKRRSSPAASSSRRWRSCFSRCSRTPTSSPRWRSCSGSASAADSRCRCRSSTRWRRPGRAAECAGLRVTVNNVMHLLIPLFFGSLGTAFGYTLVFRSNSGDARRRRACSCARRASPADAASR